MIAFWGDGAGDVRGAVKDQDPPQNAKGRNRSFDPGHLAVPAMNVAFETNPSVGEQIADALEAGDWPLDLLGLIARALPESSVALATPAAHVFQRLADPSMVG